MFAFTVDLVDIATGWTEQRAVWGKGETGVFEQIRDVEKTLPFAILGFDCDNGSEFLNYHLLRYFTKRRRPVAFTRSRAYHKDDNAHIEQKNWTHISNGSDMTGWIIPELLLFSIISTQENGGSSTISSALR